jgi:hypothetical protein
VNATEANRKAAQVQEEKRLNMRKADEEKKQQRILDAENLFPEIYSQVQLTIKGKVNLGENFAYYRLSRFSCPEDIREGSYVSNLRIGW